MFSSVSTATILFCYALLPFTSAHMEMSEPLPMRSRLDPLNTGDSIDYNLKSPLNADGSNYPCHGYQNDRPIRTTATYTAGNTYNMSIAGTVTHGGGSCQLSLSYDNGATFKVIQSMIGGCPVTQNYDFTVPSFAPSGVALFAWTWFNEIGNREMYMNCAQVQIVGSSAARRSKEKRQGAFSSMSSLPNIWRANIQGLNTCKTTEGLDLVYPDVGPKVIWGGAMKSSDPADTQVGCESSSPAGQTYKNLGGTGAASGNTTVPTASVVVSSSPTATSVGGGGGIFAEGASNGTTSSNSTAPSTSATMAPLGSTTSATLSALATPSASATPTQTPQTFNGSASFTTFASPSNITSYLPCVPGAFLCMSQTSYMICDQVVGSTPFTPTSNYVGPLQVAAGMQCAPYLAQFLTPSDAARFANTPATPAGWYRSDRYLRL